MDKKGSMSHVTTSEKILEATLDVIEERSICETRMRHIAEKADVYQSNLHYYYKTKKELLLEVQKKVASRCIELREMTKIDAEDTLESQLDIFLKQKLVFIMEEQKYDYAEIEFWVLSRFDEDFKAEFKRSFFGWRKELQNLIVKYRPEIEVAEQVLMASVIISLLEGATIQYLADPEVFEVENYFAFCKKLIIRNIQT